MQFEAQSAWLRTTFSDLEFVAALGQAFWNVSPSDRHSRSQMATRRELDVALTGKQGDHRW
jgi:hypothetical protein